MTTVKFLSASKLSLLQMCPEAFRFKYEAKVPEPSSGTFLFGKAIHAVAEKALRQVMLGNKLPTVNTAFEWVKPIFDGLIEEEEGKDSFIGWDWNDGDNPKKALEDAYPLVKRLIEEVLPTVRPKFVEQDFNVEVTDEDGTRIRVYGIIDVMEDGGKITDWKTANGKVSANARKHDVQIDTYGYWHHVFTGEDTAKLRKVYLVRNGKRPKLDKQEYVVNHSHRGRFERFARAAWKLIHAGGYIPVTGTWKCSEKFCSFWGICPFGGEIE